MIEISEIVMSQIINLSRAGFPASKLAKKFGVKQQVIWKICHENGIHNKKGPQKAQNV